MTEVLEVAKGEGVELQFAKIGPGWSVTLFDSDVMLAASNPRIYTL